MGHRLCLCDEVHFRIKYVSVVVSAWFGDDRGLPGVTAGCEVIAETEVYLFTFKNLHCRLGYPLQFQPELDQLRG